MVPETVIILEELNHRGRSIKKDVAMIIGPNIIINKERLSPAEIITQSDHLTKISSFLPSEITDQCPGGKFKHFLKKGDIVKVEYGCLNSERFRHLKKSFKALKKDRVTE